jgi:DNA polymerase-3 subunit delta
LIIKTQNLIPQKEVKKLINITQVNQNSYLIILYYSNINNSSNYQKDKKNIDSLVKSFSKNEVSCFVRFFKPFLNEALEILHLKAKNINLNISIVAIKFLYQYCHEDLDIAYNELSKLALLNKDITNEDIKEISSQISFDDSEELFLKILDKKDFLLDMEMILEHKLKDIELIRLFCDFLSNLILFNLFIKENGFFDSKAIMGVKLPRNIEEQRAKLAIKYKLPKYTKILIYLQSLELDIKTNNYIDNKMYLYSAFSRLQQKL